MKPLISVAVDAPLSATLDYAWAGEKLSHGAWVSVPLGRRTVLGLVVAEPIPGSPEISFAPGNSGLDPSKIRSIVGPVVGLPPVDSGWIALTAFAARYYRRSFGTVSVGLIPKWLRDLKNYQSKSGAGAKSGATSAATNFERLWKSIESDAAKLPTPLASTLDHAPALNADQAQALAAITAPGVYVLHGVTGSGKTRVYTEAARAALAKDDASQVLMMVPEIGLTPQLVARFRQALPGISIAVLHSEVSERERAKLWLSAATGRARLVIGTRLAIMTPMPGLRLIMIDEEHDHSYKQQEGLRYSARDLAVWRAQQLGATLVLGSATPSIETWAQIDRGRYQRLCLPQRATGEPAAPIRLIDTLKDPATEGLSFESRAAISSVLAQGGQVLVFLNRRGYAPVLGCGSCGWSSLCRDCGVATVLHKLTSPKNAAATPSKNAAAKAATKGAAIGAKTGAENAPTAASSGPSAWRLQCHHCGLLSGVPRQCPECGDPDLQPLGRGVQRLEQTLAQAFPQARILRIDRDSVRQAKALAQALETVERGEVDIVVGTQMLAKGHDFARMRLVVVADADTQLLNPDFRAPERLFATLMQVAGRAGRHESVGDPAQVLIQTRYPQHRLYRHLLSQDVAGFARMEMDDRQAAGLPPFAHMAAVRAAYRDEGKTRQLLHSLRDQLQQTAAEHSWAVTVYGPLARYPEVQAGKWRGQILLESSSRQALHQLLSSAEDWIAEHRELDCHVEVDPMEV